MFIVAVALTNIKSGANGTSTLSNLKRTSKSMIKICHTTFICLTHWNKTASVLRRATYTEEPVNIISSSKNNSFPLILNCNPSNLTSLTGRPLTQIP
jgi:hypothetical protein